MPANTIAFQGLPGAYSDLSCRSVFPDMTTLPCASFEDAFAAVHEGRARLAMIPVENSVAGRVADIHHLLPDGGLHIVGEHFQRVNHQLLALKGATLAGLQTVRSHIQALSQCRNAIRALGIQPVTHADTAEDESRYQTVFAKNPGAVAAPTAALHFDDALLAAIDARGARRAWAGCWSSRACTVRAHASGCWCRWRGPPGRSAFLTAARGRPYGKLASFFWKRLRATQPPRSP